MAGAALTFQELFEPEFLRSLQRLRLRARRAVRMGRYAEQRARDLGHGLEFKDFRPYVAGDDLRSIDWNIYRRLGKLFEKLFEEQKDLPLYLMPDVSASMFMEESPRIRAAQRAALAVAAVSLGQHDSVGLFPFAQDLEIRVKSKSGKASLMSFARHLAGLAEHTETDLSGSIRHFCSLKLRPGLLVILSDFFDPAGIEAVIAALRPCRHRLLLIQLARPSDEQPALQGDVRLTDSETGHTLDVSITPQVLERYREAYSRFRGALEQFVRQRQAILLRLDPDADVLEQLAQLFESGRLLV
jgi:uncharacterized protein (DUF58 family)